MRFAPEVFASPRAWLIAGLMILTPIVASGCREKYYYTSDAYYGPYGSYYETDYVYEDPYCDDRPVHIYPAHGRPYRPDWDDDDWEDYYEDLEEEREEYYEELEERREKWRKHHRHDRHHYPWARRDRHWRHPRYCD